ncbi:hypothetical protein Tco_0460366, partial [Tanacetum coccineum]
ENQKGKGPDWMFDLDLLTPSMKSKEQGISCDDVEDLDDQQFIVHTAQPMHPKERTAAKEVQLSSEEQTLRMNLMNSKRRSRGNINGRIHVVVVSYS